MKKKFNSLKLGDVIWANPETIGKHIFIICESNPDSSFECYPSVNLSSHCSDCSDCCIDIKKVDIPKDWFRFTKSVSYLRIDNPICLNKMAYENKHYSFKGNLKENYSDLFDKICAHSSSVTKQVCGCKTVKD